MTSTKPIKVTALRGFITEGLFGKGTKSEHQAFFIETADNRYIFRQKIGSAFYDAELKLYVGHEVECEGFLVDRTLLAERIKIVG